MRDRGSVLQDEEWRTGASMSAGRTKRIDDEDNEDDEEKDKVDDAEAEDEGREPRLAASAERYECKTFNTCCAIASALPTPLDVVDEGDDDDCEAHS